MEEKEMEEMETTQGVQRDLQVSEDTQARHQVVLAHWNQNVIQAHQVTISTRVQLVANHPKSRGLQFPVLIRTSIDCHLVPTHTNSISFTTCRTDRHRNHSPSQSRHQYSHPCLLRNSTKMSLTNATQFTLSWSSLVQGASYHLVQSLHPQTFSTSM